MVFSIRKELSKWGFRGLVLHAFMLMDVLALFLLIECQLLPWELLQNVKPHLTYSLPLASFSFASLCYVGFTDTVTSWLLETEDRPKWIAAPAVILIFMTVMTLTEGKPKPAPSEPPQKAAPASPADNSLIRYNLSASPSMPVMENVIKAQDEPAPVVNAAPVPAEMTWKDWAGVILVGFLTFVGFSKHLHNQRRNKAHKNAHTFVAENVHGAAGYAKAAAAKKGGWL